MKRKNWKRTAAFVTSMTMATTMMPTEIATVIVNAAGANASAEIVKLDWEQTKYDSDNDGIKDDSYIKSIKVNGSTQTNIIYNDSMKFAAGSNVEITSKVPLNISFNHNNFTLVFADFKNELGINFDETNGKFTRNDKEVSKELVLAEMLAYAGYAENDKTFSAAWNVNDNGEFKDDENNIVAPVATVTFAAIETKGNGQYTYKFTMPDDNGFNSGVEDLVTVSTSKSKIKVNFYENEAARTADKQAGSDNGVWTQTQEGEACDKYFGGTLIESSNDKNVGNYVDTADEKNTGIAAPNVVIVGDTVTITADNPFIAHVSDGNDEHSWINASNSFEKNKYKSEFTMPKYDGVEKDPEKQIIIIDIVKVNENYTYKVNGNELLADADTGSFKNVVAAKIVAKYYDSKAAAEAAGTGFGEKNDEGKEITGAVPNGSYVVVGTEIAGRITAKPQDINKAFKVKKNGTTVYESAIADADDNGSYKYAANGTAGTYNATYTVKGTDGHTYDLSYSFRIAAKEELTAADVSLTLSAKEDNKDVPQATLEDIMAPGETIKERKSIEDGKVVTFMLAKGKDKDIADSGNSKYQFTVTPAIDELLKDAKLDPAKCYVDGVTSGSTLGKEYQFIIHVTDPEFGGSDTNPKDIKIKWKVVSYDEIPHWENNRFKAAGKDNYTDAQISIDELDKFDDVLSEAAQANDAAKDAVKNGEVRYQWIKAPGANRTKEKQDELDEWDDDLPSELGDYTVYIIYKDVVEATVDVSISLYSVGIYADESDLTFKYGHNFELTKPTVQKDAKGEVVDVEIENLTCTVYKAEEVVREGTKVWVPLDEVVEDLDGNDLENVSVDNVGQLNAGHYFIEFKGNSLDEKFAVKAVPQLLTVDQKKLDDPSLVILIDPFAYDGTTKDVVKDRYDNKSNFTVRDMDFEEGDPRYNISDLFKITEGGKQSAIGAHDCTFTLVSKVEEDDPDFGDADERTLLLNNFDGKTKNSEWHITAERANETGGYDGVNPRNIAYNKNKVTIDAGLKWNDDNTTLYDNGRIHLEITRNADDKIRSDKKTAKIEKFGVIIDKEGKIVAPDEYDGYTPEEVADAEKFLQFGNGFTEGGYTKTSKVTCASQTYKVNIEVKNVETGVWARPYVLYEDGTVSYGDVRYLDLTNEAINRLQLWTAPTTYGEKAVRKADLDKYQTANETLIKSNVQSGYNTAENKFYVYSRYVDLKTAGFTNVAEVADFGIVADRNGEFDAALEEVFTAAYDAAKADGKGDATATENANAAVKEYMTKNLKKETANVVGHYDKKNKVLGVNEYAASIKLGNAATGCWVRSYIDLGNGLVIYNEPMYIQSASQYYGNDVAGTFSTEWEKKQIGGTEDAPVYNYYSRLVFEHNNSAEDRIADFAAKAGVNVKNVEVVRTGVVADKNNKLVQANKMILNAGFLNGIHKDGYDKAYSAKLTPNGSNDVSVRTYTIFKIKGAEKDVEVTVYGDVKTYKYSETSKRVVEEIGNPDMQIANDEVIAAPVEP